MLHISSISTLTRQSLCALLDTEDKLGRDWCLLAVRMGLIDKVPKLEGAKRGQSQMGKLLDEWQRQPATASSIGKECRLSAAVTRLITFPLHFQATSCGGYRILGVKTQSRRSSAGVPCTA